MIIGSTFNFLPSFLDQYLIMEFNPFTNKFLFFGHRGAPHFAPENTLISFKNAIDMGVDGIELDVISTLDEKIVIHHDVDFLKLTGKPTKLSSMVYDEIKKIDVSRKWNSEFGFQKIPLLSEIVELLDSNQIILNIEINLKSFSILYSYTIPSSTISP